MVTHWDGKSQTIVVRAPYDDPDQHRPAQEVKRGGTLGAPKGYDSSTVPDVGWSQRPRNKSSVRAKYRGRNTEVIRRSLSEQALK
jgi:hypothetical protein